MAKLINRIHRLSGPKLTAHDERMVRSLAMQSEPDSGAEVRDAGKVAMWRNGEVAIRPRRDADGWIDIARYKRCIVEFVEC